MKMRTKMEGRVVAVIKLHDDVNGVISDLAQDAAYAHALLMAMDECSTNLSAEQYRDSVLGRALDLMESWGYVGEGNGSR